MSLAETQQIMQVCQEIIQLLGTAEIKTENILADMPQTEKAFDNFKKLERVAVRYLAITQQMGLPDDVNRLVAVLAKIIVLIKMAQSALMGFTGGPLGMAMSAASLLMTGLAAGSMLEGY